MTSRLALIAIFLLLSGCSQIPRQPTDGSPHTTLPSPPEQWQLNAKLGVRNGEDSGSITLNWQQSNSGYRIHIQGPLGKGKATINGNDDYIVLERPGQEPLYSNNANTLIQEVFGWDLPIADFRFWIRGIANPNRTVDANRFSDQGTLLSLQQSNWQLSFSRYEKIRQWLLPGRIRAEQEGAQLTLIIRQWQLP